jgi:hypothetical protein
VFLPKVAEASRQELPVRTCQGKPEMIVGMLTTLGGLGFPKAGGLVFGPTSLMRGEEHLGSLFRVVVARMEWRE